MERTETNKLPFSKVDQIGVMVRNIDEAIKYYESLGIGPFEPSGLTATNRRVYGKAADDVKNVSRTAQMGQVHLELLQPIAGQSLQREFLERRGEGINHLGFYVDDLDKEVAKVMEKGFKPISTGKFPGGGGFAYFDTDKVGGVMFELIEWPPQHKWRRPRNQQRQ
jgi:methylmalonyl-CoA/ethylmalonyl-CoA epimerase